MNKEKEDDQENMFEKASKIFYLLVDLSFFLVIHYCLYSTFLNLVYFLFLMISITLGIFLKKYLERLIGNQEIFFLWRPFLPDPYDDHVLEVAVTPFIYIFLGQQRCHFFRSR